MLYPTALLADALADRLVQGYRELYGAREPECADFVAVATRLTLQLIGDSDALYHDAHHTALVTLVGQDILRGRMLATRVEPRDWAHLTLAMLLHDIGFVRGVCPGDGLGRCVVDGQGTTASLPRGASDAWLAPTTSSAASSRCAPASPTFLASMPSGSRAPSSAPASQCPTIATMPSADDEAGLVRAADLIGQLADPLYLRRAGALYHEFADTGVAAKLGYGSPAGLVEKYPKFYWDRISPTSATRCVVCAGPWPARTGSPTSTPTCSRSSTSCARLGRSRSTGATRSAEPARLVDHHPQPRAEEAFAHQAHPSRVHGRALLCRRIVRLPAMKILNLVLLPSAATPPILLRRSAGR